MLSIHRFETADLFWSLWRIADGKNDDPDVWASLSPALSRLDLLCEDSELEGHHRGAIAQTVNELRGRRGAKLDRIEGELRRLANTVLAILQADYTFKPASVPTAQYLKIIRAALRARDAQPAVLNQSTLVSDAVRYARLDPTLVAAGIAKLIDEELAEYEFDSPDGDEAAYRILDDESLALRVEELEEAHVLETKISVSYKEPLRDDYRDLIEGLARAHDVAATGAPTGAELALRVVDLTGDAATFKANIIAFANALEAVLRTPKASSVVSSPSFHGSTFIGSPIQIGSPGASQTVHNTVDIGDIKTCFAQVKEALAETTLDDDTREIVDDQIVQIEKQLAKPKPNPKLLLPMATTVLTALGTVGAAGAGVEYVEKLIALLSMLG